MKRLIVLTLLSVFLLACTPEHKKAYANCIHNKQITDDAGEEMAEVLCLPILEACRDKGSERCKKLMEPHRKKIE